MKYQMYIDEVGNPDLGSSDNPIHRFLSLTGVIFDIEPKRIQETLTIKNLKVKLKSNNISGLKITDLNAHPSRDEIHNEHNHPEIEISDFANKVIQILQYKYYQQAGKLFGKKFI
jgi:hypothetical protein